MKNKREKIGKIVKKSLRVHKKQDVLHGSQNIAIQIPKEHRKPGDWDIYSTEEKKRAYQLERKFDKKFKNPDFADVKKAKWKKGKKKFVLYQVDTPVKGGDVDIMNRPKGLRTKSFRGMSVLLLQDELKGKHKAKKVRGKKTKSKKDITIIRRKIHKLPKKRYKRNKKGQFVKRK